MRVYISGPISNNPDYELDFRDADQLLTERGYTAINPSAFNNCLPPDLEYEEYMKLDLALLEMCDAIYMLDGWEESPGANREYGYALGLGKKIMEE